MKNNNEDIESLIENVKEFFGTYIVGAAVFAAYLFILLH